MEQLRSTEKVESYKEIWVDSFPSSVDRISEEISCEENTKRLDHSNFCLVDIDGVLITNNLVKLPILTHLVKPEIDQKTTDAFLRLINLFDSSLVISTNRGISEETIFNCKEVLRTVDNLIEKSGQNIPIFTGLFKQVPGLIKEDITKKYLNENAREQLKKKTLNKPSSEILIHYIGKKVCCEESEESAKSDEREVNINSMTLYSIEDLSIASLNRSTFLKYVARELKNLYDINVSIRNFVIKR